MSKAQFPQAMSKTQFLLAMSKAQFPLAISKVLFHRHYFIKKPKIINAWQRKKIYHGIIVAYYYDDHLIKKPIGNYPEYHDLTL